MTCARLLPLLLAGTLALAACGDEDRAAEVRELPTTSTATTAPEPTTSTEEAPPPAAATGPSGPAEAPAPDERPEANPGGAAAEANPGGAGDEEPIRQPATFRLGSVTLEPGSVQVAPFLAVELEVVNVDEGFHDVKLIGTDVAFRVLSGQTETRVIDGLQAGAYTLSVDGGKQVATLAVGDEVGP